MSELLIVRALRYQWRIVFGIFLPLMLAAHVALTFGMRRSVNVSAATSVRETPVPTPKIDAAPAAPPVVKAEPSIEKQMQRWRAGVRYLDARIEEARAGLLNPHPAGVPSVSGSEVGVSGDEKVERSIISPPSSEETMLRRSIAEQKRRLEALRAIDTDAHPDVIEATEHLDHLQSQLTQLERRSQREHPAVDAKATQTGPVLPTINSETQENIMRRLSELIRQRAYLVTQMQRAAAAPGTAPAADVEWMPLLGSSTADAHSQPVLVTKPKSSRGFSRPPVEVVAAVLSAMLALAIASWMEASQDHIAGPIDLQARLPDDVMFLGAVPRMRRQ